MLSHPVAPSVSLTEKILLLQGYFMETNTDDHFFAYGNGVTLPPADILTTCRRTGRHVMYLQATNTSSTSDTTFTGYVNNNAFTWLMHDSCGTCEVSPGKSWNHGYYFFSDTTGGHTRMQISDLRLYSVAAITLYEGGKLVESVLDSYLDSAQGTIPPSPIAISRVVSPAELAREVTSGHNLTCVASTSVSSIWADGLRYSDQFDSLSTFVASMDGPRVRAWNGVHRVTTIAAEAAVPGRSVMVAPLSVSASAGLKTVEIYLNGHELFRRFEFSTGTKDFFRTFYLNGAVHSTLTLVVMDQAGRRAVTAARRNWKAGRRSVVFCTDHM